MFIYKNLQQGFNSKRATLSEYFHFFPPKGCPLSLPRNLIPEEEKLIINYG